LKKTPHRGVWGQLEKKRPNVQDGSRKNKRGSGVEQGSKLGLTKDNHHEKRREDSLALNGGRWRGEKKEGKRRSKCLEGT